MHTTSMEEALMAKQLELISSSGCEGHPTIALAFEYYWNYHMRFLPSAISFMGNRKAICKTIGHLPFKDLTRPQIMSLHIPHRVHFPHGLKHDLVLLSMLYNKMRDWSEDRFVSDGIDFAKIIVPPLNPTARIKRPKVYSRQVVYDPNELSRIFEHANERLMDRIYFAIDTAQSGIDLKSLRSKQYDAQRDGFSFIRHKTGQREFIPASERCRAVALKAIRQGREFILNWTNHRFEWEEAQKLAKVNKQWRDIRKTSINRVHNSSGRIDIAKKIAIHASSRTTEEHYIIGNNDDLRPWVNDLEKTFSVGKRSIAI